MLLALAAGPAMSATFVVWEYHDAARDRWFVTASPAEERALDATETWARTRFGFRVHDAPGPGLVPVCRFVRISAAVRAATHFWSADPDECASLSTDPSWIEEGTVFHVAPVDDQGRCPAETGPVFRLYDPSRATLPAHRFTPRREARAALLADGWVAEGRGEGIAFCVPYASADEVLLRLRELVGMAWWVFEWSFPAFGAHLVIPLDTVEWARDPARVYEVRSGHGTDAVATWDRWLGRVVIELKTLPPTLLVFPFDGGNEVIGCAYSAKRNDVVYPPPPIEQLDLGTCTVLTGTRNPPSP
jgi:hypothetical protein